MADAGKDVSLAALFLDVRRRQCWAFLLPPSARQDG